MERSCLSCLAKSSSEKVSSRIFLRQLLRLRLVHHRLRLLDQGQHVAHAEDARGQPVGVERLQRVRLLADARRRRWAGR